MSLQLEQLQMAMGTSVSMPLCNLSQVHTCRTHCQAGATKKERPTSDSFLFPGRCRPQYLTPVRATMTLLCHNAESSQGSSHLALAADIAREVPRISQRAPDDDLYPVIGLFVTFDKRRPNRGKLLQTMVQSDAIARGSSLCTSFRQDIYQASPLRPTGLPKVKVRQ